MSKRKYKRSRLLINPEFQYKLIAIFVVVSILMSLFIVAFAWQSYNSFVSDLNEKGTELSLYTDMVNEFMEPGAQVFWVPAEYKTQITIRLLGLTSVLAIVVIILGVFISHRIAGPLHRLNNSFLSIASGKVASNLRFRDHDEFQHLAESFNKCVEQLDGGRKELLNAEKNLFDSVKETLRTSSDSGNQNKVFELLG